ncbi:unnamed protein product, partial [Prorocentrum cordatum]
ALGSVTSVLGACRRMLLPQFLQPPSFEERLRRSLSQLRCEFSLEVVRGEGGVQRVGLQVQDAGPGGLEVTEVTSDGLVGARNAAVERSGERLPVVRPGDRLLSVNGARAVGHMVEVLTDSSVTRLAMTFGRPAAQSAPGVWEADMERLPDEGWGLQLQECGSGSSSRGAPALRVDGVTEGLAVARWNAGRGARWAVEPGDLVVACEPEVGAAGVAAMLRDRQRVRLMLLRWHAGPAPEAPPAGGRGPAPLSFEVTLERSQETDALGLILDPSSRDPTRTVVKEVLPGKLVDRHNRRAEATFQLCVSPGDEVESVNGERAPDRFAERCKAQRITLCLVRRGAEAARAGPAA